MNRRRIYSPSTILFLLALLWSGASSSVAQKANSCDRELRDSSKVVLNTPVEQSTGRVCLDDGDSFGVGNGWVRLRGIDAPEIARGCLKHFDALPARCEASRGAIHALLALSELLETGAVCQSHRKGHLNRWPVDCTMPGDRSLAKEMIDRGLACATNNSPDDYKAADFNARKNRTGLWGDEFSASRAGFPSDQCGQATRRYSNHVKYLERKARRRS